MKGLIVFSNDMEDVEALATRALLIRTGYHMDSITFQSSKDIITAFGLHIKADYLKDEINHHNYDFLVIPGGKYVAYNVDKDQMIKSLAKTFNSENKVVCAICAGPRFLGQAELLNNVKFTAFTGSEIDAPLGKYLPKSKVIVDQKIITARGAGAVYEFVYEIVTYFSGKNHADQLLEQILY
ncbi:MAG: DJ-1/PfpI family protein [Acholeplasmataceae bacterium]